MTEQAMISSSKEDYEKMSVVISDRTERAKSVIRTMIKNNPEDLVEMLLKEFNKLQEQLVNQLVRANEKIRTLEEHMHLSDGTIVCKINNRNRLIDECYEKEKKFDIPTYVRIIENFKENR